MILCIRNEAPHRKRGTFGRNVLELLSAPTGKCPTLLALPISAFCPTVYATFKFFKFEREASRAVHLFFRGYFSGDPPAAWLDPTQPQGDADSPPPTSLHMRNGLRHHAERIS